MNIKGAIFDLDGTLLDSMGIWDTVGADYLRSLGIRPQEKLKEIIKDMSMVQGASYFQEAYGVDKTVHEIIAGINARIEGFYKNEAVLKAGAADFLRKLAEKNVKMCIATATDKYLVEAALVRCGVRGYFEEIFTCTEVGYGKDEPEIYETALQSLGTQKSETGVFEDAVYAARTAKRAGFVVAGVYDRFEKEQEKIRNLSDYYITSFAETEGMLR